MLSLCVRPIKHLKYGSGRRRPSLLCHDYRDLFGLTALPSTSFGKNRLIYYMGGIDNWWFAEFNEEINVDTTINYTYQTLATNMRGFTQNIRNGTSFFVLNSELRFSIIRFLVKKPLKNDFLNSFQVVAFGDIGTAWTGLTPYSEDNSLLRE